MDQFFCGSFWLFLVIFLLRLLLTYLFVVFLHCSSSCLLGNSSFEPSFLFFLLLPRVLLLLFFPTWFVFFHLRFWVVGFSFRTSVLPFLLPSCCILLEFLHRSGFDSLLYLIVGLMGRFGLFHFFLPSLVPQFCACYFRSVSCFVLLFFSVRRLEFCFVNFYTVSIDTHCSIHTLFVGSPFTSPVFHSPKLSRHFLLLRIESNCLLIPFCPSSGVQIGIFSALGVCTLVAHTVLYCFSICLLGC